MGVGCTAIPKHRVHRKFISNPETRAPNNVVILPADIPVSEISARGVTEEVPAWTEKAKNNVNAALKNFKQVNINALTLELSGINKKA